MAVSSRVYGQAQRSLVNAEVDFDTATIKAMLCTAAYIPDQDTHRYRSDVTDEVAGIGYVAGGVALANKTVNYDAGSNTLRLASDNPSWPGSSITARFAVFYVDTGDPATSPLLCYWDFGADFTSANGAFDLLINPAGLITLQAA